jgi:rhodanese-related sulfurtransferase
VNFIGIDKLLEMMENKDSYKLVEVLGADEYAKGHIPGAISIPVDQLEAKAPKMLKKTDIVVVYCANYHCGASTAAAKALLKIGYKKVLDFKGGKWLWQWAGLGMMK